MVKKVEIKKIPQLNVKKSVLLSSIEPKSIKKVGNEQRQPLFSNKSVSNRSIIQPIRLKTLSNNKDKIMKQNPLISSSKNQLKSSIDESSNNNNRKIKTTFSQIPRYMQPTRSMMYRNEKWMPISHEKEKQRGISNNRIVINNKKKTFNDTYNNKENFNYNQQQSSSIIKTTKWTPNTLKKLREKKRKPLTIPITPLCLKRTTKKFKKE